jgi:hypothetical protein
VDVLFLSLLPLLHFGLLDLLYFLLDDEGGFGLVSTREDVFGLLFSRFFLHTLHQRSQIIFIIHIFLVFLLINVDGQRVIYLYCRL